MVPLLLDFSTFTYFALSLGAKYCDLHLCVSVCLTICLLEYLENHTSKPHI